MPASSRVHPRARAVGSRWATRARMSSTTCTSVLSASRMMMASSPYRAARHLFSCTCQGGRCWGSTPSSSWCSRSTTRQWISAATATTSCEPGEPVAGPHLDRPEQRRGPDVPPQLAGVVDHARREHVVQVGAVLRPRLELEGQPRGRQLLEQHRAVARVPGVGARPVRRGGRQGGEVRVVGQQRVDQRPAPSPPTGCRRARARRRSPSGGPTTGCGPSGSRSGDRR